MSNNKILFILLLIISLQSIAKCEVEPEVISINCSKSLDLTEDTSFNAYFALEYKEQDLLNKGNLIISTRSSSFDNPAFIYASFIEKYPSADNRTFYSQSLGVNELIINVTKIKNESTLFINVHSLKECSLNFTVLTKNEITLSLENNKAKFKISDLTTLYFTPSQKDASKKIMFYAIGESANYFSMQILYSYDNAIIKEYSSEQKFENGYGAIIDLEEVMNPYDGSFIITIVPNDTFPGIFANEKVVEVGLSLTEESNNTLLEVNILEHIYGYTTFERNCYTINNVENNRNLTILVNSFTQAM